MRLGKQRVLVTGIEVRRVAGQHGGVVYGRLRKVVRIVVAEEVVPLSEGVVYSGNIFVIELNRGLVVIDCAADLPGGFRSGVIGK